MSLPKNQIHPLLLRKEKVDIDEFDGVTTIRQIVEKVLNTYYGKVLDFLSAQLSLSSFLLYVLSTYMEEINTWYYYVDLGLMIFYIVEYSLKFYTAQHRFHYLTSTNSLIDLLTIVPIFFPKNPSEILMIIVSCGRIIRILRVARAVNKLFQIGKNEVNRQIFTIILTVLTLIFVTAGILEAFENPTRARLIQQQLEIIDQGLCPPTDLLKLTTYHEMIYFVVVTLATVGYGDVTPKSELGRLGVIIFIIITLVLIPKQTNELIRLMGMQSVYAREVYKPNSEVPHLVICGNVGVDALKNFCQELFHPDHGSIDRNAVILQQSIPTSEMEIFLRNPQFEIFLKYLQGNPMMEKDLKRAAAHLAKASIILTNKYVVDSMSADHKNIMTALSIKKNIFSQDPNAIENCRMVVQLIKPESKTHYFSSLNFKSHDQLIIVEEIKMNLLAKSCFCPGIISLLGNLITSAGDQDTEKLSQEWLKEYVQGMGHEIYRTQLSKKFQGKKFSEVAGIVYKEFQGIVFGLELQLEGQIIIILNPGSYEIPESKESNIFVYLICQDKKVADQVATYEMSPDQIQIMHQQARITSNKLPYSKLPTTEREEDTSKSENDDFSIASIDHMDENELLELDYVLLQEPVSLVNATSISVADSVEIINHIVVCGMHPSIYYFLLPLRANYLKELQHIVILSPQPPNIDAWESINRFPKVIFIKGSPLLTEDLQRANIHFADKAVVFGHEMRRMDDSSEEMIDAESIFIYKAIKKCNKNIQIMVELVYSSNIEFLASGDISSGEKNNKYHNSEFKYSWMPMYSSGEVYISALIDTLTCQSYFNPHIVTILQQILTGGKQSNPVIMGICEQADLKQSNLWQIPIPEDFMNKTFGDLFHYLSIERNLIPLGLYRLPGATDNKHSYVYTNPPDTVKLSHRDKVFVLGSYMPEDLFGAKFISKQNINMHLNQEGKEIKELNIQQGKTDLQNDGNMKFEVGGKKKDNIAKKQLSHLDLESINSSSATFLVLQQINAHLTEMQKEIYSIKENLRNQDEQIIEKVKTALRQEITTITQQINLK